MRETLLPAKTAAFEKSTVLNLRLVTKETKNTLLKISHIHYIKGKL